MESLENIPANSSTLPATPTTEQIPSPDSATPPLPQEGERGISSQSPESPTNLSYQETPTPSETQVIPTTPESPSTQQDQLQQPAAHPEPQHSQSPPLQAFEPSFQRSDMLDFRTRVLAGKKKKYEVRLEKVLAIVRAKQRITNQEIQKAFRVSDATATRYVQELIRRGLIKKSGRTRSIFYEPL